jgi:hypothetical protein
MLNEDPITDESIQRDLRSAMAIDSSPDFSARVRSRLHHETMASRTAMPFRLMVCACVMAVALSAGFISWNHRQAVVPSQPTVAIETPDGVTAPLLWQVSSQARPLQPSATIVSGTDIGFRVDATKNGMAIGRLVVRVNGEWMDAQFSSNNMRVIPIREK